MMRRTKRQKPRRKTKPKMPIIMMRRLERRELKRRQLNRVIIDLICIPIPLNNSRASRKRNSLRMLLTLKASFSSIKNYDFLVLTLSTEKVKNATPNMAALKEYRRREEEFLKRAKDLEEVTRLRDQAKQKHDGLRKQRLDEFMTGFTAISSKLKEMYQVSYILHWISFQP